MEGIKVKTNNFWANRIDPETKKKYKPRALVLHITDSSFASTKYWFTDPLSNASSNYVVDTNGTWYEFVNPKHAAWANGKVVRPTWKNIEIGVNPNLYTISVEVVNSGQFPSWRQWSSWAKGCREIMKAYDITDVVDHYEIRAGKTCPRPWFTRFYLKLLQSYV